MVHILFNTRMPVSFQSSFLLTFVTFYILLSILTVIIYWYYTYLLKIDAEEYGSHGALLQEGLFASFTFFLVTNQFQKN
jgi:hypothetical protein